MYATCNVTHFGIPIKQFYFCGQSFKTHFTFSTNPQGEIVKKNILIVARVQGNKVQGNKVHKIKFFFFFKIDALRVAQIPQIQTHGTAHTHNTVHFPPMADCLESRTDPKNRQTLNPLQGEEQYCSFPEEHH